MRKNSSLYNRVYHARKRQDLIDQLGGKCEVCGIKQDLIIHRIFTGYNVGNSLSSKQTDFDGDVVNNDNYKAISSSVFKKRLALLRNNPTNMVLVCYNCYSVLRHKYGRKKRIGRKEIAYFRGDFSPLVFGF